MDVRNDSFAATGEHAVSTNTYISRPATGCRKRIVICCDGTWQSAVSMDPKQGCPSNVARISRVLARAGIDDQDQRWEQLVYYDAGVGTGNITTFEKQRQGGLGIGLLENVIEAYNFIVNNYSPGDELFFFGFSRGAYTVRSAAGLACKLGIIKPSAMRKFLTLYNTYITEANFAKPFPKSEAWINWVKDQKGEVYTSKAGSVKIKVIGVFDTVGSLGVPDLGHVWRVDNSETRKAFEFHDVSLNEHIEHAYHAIALDEQRSAFAPSIWEQASGDSKTELCQCWFPGVHINIGGGSDANADPDKPLADGEQLASVSYTWMLDRIMPYLAFDRAALQSQKDDIEHARSMVAAREADKATKQQQGWTEWLGGLASSLKRGFRNSSGAQSAAKAVDATIGTVSDSHTLMYDMMGFPQARQPGQTAEKGKSTMEMIHPSVSQRQNYLKSIQENYEPAGLQGWERVREEGGDGKRYRWVKYQSSNDKKVVHENGGFVIERALPEWVTDMPPKQSMEKWLEKLTWEKIGQAT